MRRFLLATTLAFLVVSIVCNSVSASVWTGARGIWTNINAFKSPCLGFDDAYPAEMRKQAKDGLDAIGWYAGYNVSGADFTKSAFLNALTSVKNETYGEGAVYVHSHGDVYRSSSIRAAFLTDPGVGDCNDWSTDNISNFAIKAKFDASPTQEGPTPIVIMSTCWLGAATHPVKDLENKMPEAFGIAKNKTQNDGFYMGYKWETYDSAQYKFEGRFFDYIDANPAYRTFKQAFTYASGYSAPSGNPVRPELVRIAVRLKGGKLDERDREEYCVGGTCRAADVQHHRRHRGSVRR